MDDEKKKVKQAIALEYDPSDDAPRVVASGKLSVFRAAICNRGRL